MVVSKIVAVCRLRILWRWRRKLKLELFTCSRSNIRIINVLEVKLNGGDGIMGWYPVDNRSPLNTEDWVPKLKVECCFSDDLDRWSKGAYSIIFRLITLKRHLVVFFATFFVLTWKLVSFACFFHTLSTWRASPLHHGLSCFSKKDCTYKLGDFGLAACVMPDQAKLIVDELLEVEMIWKAATNKKTRSWAKQVSTKIPKVTWTWTLFDIFWD